MAFIIAWRRKLWFAKAESPFEALLLKRTSYPLRLKRPPFLPETTKDAKDTEVDLFVESEEEIEVEPVLEIRSVPTIALLVFWAITSLVAFSIAGEKMPWLTVNPDLPNSAPFGLGPGISHR